MTSLVHDTQNQLPTNLNENICNIYEKEIEYLKLQLTRLNNSSSILNFKNDNFDSSYTQCRLSDKLSNEHEISENFFSQLNQEYIRINSLVIEANIISNEMQQKIIYKIILQIPISYLKPNEHTINNLCELAIQVTQEQSFTQIWNIEKFEYKLNHMKDIYHKWQISENKIDLLEKELKRHNPFYDEKTENLIGIANIYLKSLFYNSKLDYIVPIINTQGEICGSIHVVLDQTGALSMKKLNDFQINSTTCGSMSDGISVDIDEQSLSNLSISQHSLEDEGIDDSSILLNSINDELTIKFSIKEIRDISQTNIENIICRYTFINPKLDQTIYSIKSSDEDNKQKSSQIFSFNHENEYTFPITDNFLSTCFESAISIEVWNQYDTKIQLINNKTKTDEFHQHNIEVEQLIKQWKDVKRHIQFSIEIHELNTLGQWEPVQVDQREQILCGGVYQLKQGQSKRLITQLRILPRSDPMPLVIDTIRSVEIGSISTRKLDAPRHLDSYQDEELKCLKKDWLNLIEKRKHYVESQINILNQQINKTPNDILNEKILLEELLHLAEEHNIAVFPPSGSGIPGSPAAWDPPITIEMHRPLIYLKLAPIKMNISNEIAGLQALLTEENKTTMLQLPLIHHASDEIHATAQWNPSIHDSPAMNQVTPNGTVIYLIVKIIATISQPVHMEIVLRKRIAVTMNKSEDWRAGKTLKYFLGYKNYQRTSVIYEIVSNLPKNLQNIEEQNKINDEYFSKDYINKYIQYASVIDSLLLLDRLRQEVLLAENSAKQQIIRKATSAPNITPEKKNVIIFNTPRNSRRENLKKQLSLDQSELNSLTPNINKQENGSKNSNEQISSSLTSSNQSIKSSSKEVISDIEDILIGSQVIVNTGHSIINKSGIIRYIGKISNKEGTWFGIELTEPVGKNNGSLDEHSYFKCKEKRGIFVRRDKFQIIN